MPRASPVLHLQRKTQTPAPAWTMGPTQAALLTRSLARGREEVSPGVRTVGRSRPDMARCYGRQTRTPTPLWQGKGERGLEEGQGASVGTALPTSQTSTSEPAFAHPAAATKPLRQSLVLKGDFSAVEAGSQEQRVTSWLCPTGLKGESAPLATLGHNPSHENRGSGLVTSERPSS